MRYCLVCYSLSLSLPITLSEYRVKLCQALKDERRRRRRGDERKLYENGKEAKKSLNDLARARSFKHKKKIDKVTCMYLSVKLIIIRPYIFFSLRSRDFDDKSICDRLKEMNQMNVHQQERERHESEKKEFFLRERNFHWNRICWLPNSIFIEKYKNISDSNWHFHT